MRSSLSQTATQSAVQRRNQVGADGWAGEAVETLVTIDDDLPVRVEWAEGSTPRWDIWIFDQDADVQVGDIILVAELDLAATVTRTSTWMGLRGRFHHYELNSEEHELSYAELAS